MAYQYDNDLEFLKYMASDELDPLVRCLIYDTDNELRYTEELTQRDRYKRFYPDHRYYWDDIAGELQCFGANSILTILRGGIGVPYREILEDVCSISKVKYKNNLSTENLEKALLLKMASDALGKMSTSDKEQFLREIGIKIPNLAPQAIIAALQAGIHVHGFAAYKLATIIANAVAVQLFGKGLAFAANGFIMRGIGVFAGPIGMAIVALWTGIQLAGAAYRVTIPATIFIAQLRLKYLYGENKNSYDNSQKPLNSYR